MNDIKPFLTKFSRPPHRTTARNKSDEKDKVTPQPRPTIITEVRSETTDDR